jgi:hypothetical protein
MAEAIEQLQALQALDLQLEECRKLVEGFPADLAALEQEHAREQSAMEQEREGLAQLQKDRRRKEGGLQDGEAQLKKSQAKLNAVKTNKEYEATLKEIEGLRGKNSALEEEILLLYDEIEAAEAKLQEREKTWQDYERKFQEGKRALAERRDQAEAEAKELAARRAELTARLAESELALYERLRRSLGDPVVVPAEKEVCTACNRMMPAQLYIQVLKNEQVIHCPHCGRYLVHLPVPANLPSPEPEDD